MKSISTIQEAQQAINELQNRIDLLSTKNWDVKQRRIVNAHPSIDPYDYIVRKELDSRVTQVTAEGVSTIYDKATFGIGIDVGAIVGTNVCPSYIASFNLTPVICYYTAGQFPTGSNVIIDVKLNGVSFFSSNLTVLVGGSGVYEKTDFETTTLAPKDVLTVDVTQIGSGLPGVNIVVVIKFSIRGT
jgi:hypothetical protein